MTPLPRGIRAAALLASIAAAAAIPGDIADCTVDRGVCVCTGDCPPFASGWPYRTTLGAICVAAASGNATVDASGLRDGGMNGEVDVDGKEYTAPFAHCPSEGDPGEDGGEGPEGDDGGGDGGNDAGCSLARWDWKVAFAAAALVTTGMGAL